MIYLLIAGSLLALDLGIKWYVENHFTEADIRRAAGGRILLRKSYNSGMAMNLLENKPGFVKWLTAGLGLFLLVYELCLLAKGGRTVEKTGWALVLVGASSNYMIVFGESMLSITLVSGADGKKYRILCLI